MIDDTNSPVQDAEVVSETTPSPTNANPATPAFDINAYNATLDVVRRRLGILEKAKEEARKLNEMFNDTFSNDPMYNDADHVVKEALKRKKDIKTQLSKQPQVSQLNGKLHDLREQIKENEDALSSELMEYYRTSGVTEIEDADGNVQEFAIVVKLKGKKRVDK